MKYKLSASTRAAKKYMVTTPEGRIIHFGGAGYDDYTTHKDEARKARYLSRTASQPQNDITSAAFWALNLLWNKQTINESIKDIEERYRIKIVSK
jgi:hypothetical protein